MSNGTQAAPVRRRSGLMGPAVLITIGVLFLLHQTGIQEFRDTWPILLVVIGLVKLLDSAAGRGSGS